MSPFARLVLATLLFGCGTSGHSDAGAARDTGVIDGEMFDAGVVDASSSDAGLASEDASPPPDTCPTAGERRVVTCGNCGMGSQRCSDDLVWVDDGPCIGERECAVGALEVETTERCGQRARLCTDTCEWSDWDETVAPGECEVGETDIHVGAPCSPNEEVPRTCDAACTWQPDPSGCHDPCGGLARTTPAESVELCIPAGRFVRGDVMFPAAQPVAEVYVSAYLIDKFPVTNDRYRACETAGVCTRPEWSLGQAHYDHALAGDDPLFGVTQAQARTFCEWDGGRRLPTEAEWEKAARGPAPRAQPYPWDGPAYRCDLFYAAHCGWEWGPDDLLPGCASCTARIGRYDSQPGTASYYEVEFLIGTQPQWVSDRFSTDYYAQPESLTDPQGPATGAWSSRGSERNSFSEIQFNIADRHWSDLTSSRRSFRCARSVP